MNFMRRFSTDLWTGLVCGYFFVFAYEGVVGLGRLVEMVARESSRATLSPENLAYAVGALLINVLDAFAGVQLMKRVGYANILAKVMIIVHLAVSTVMLYQGWQVARLVDSYLPVFYNLSQMLLAFAVFCILGYLRVAKNDPATAAN